MRDAVMTQERKISHIPDGLTCCSCIHALEKCHHLDFMSMRVIATDKKDGTKTVKCTNFDRKGHENGNSRGMQL